MYNHIHSVTILSAALILSNQCKSKHSQDATTPNITVLEQLMPPYFTRPLDAQIYERQKTTLNLHIYVTNRNGIVIFDSTNQALGEDFSQWRDVRKTLIGEYGARASPLNYSATSAMKDEKGLFVAAPIKSNGNIIGSLTVIKGNTDLGDYIINSTSQIKLYALVAFTFSLFAGALLSWWLWRSVKKLANYATQLGQGEYIAQPKIIHSEFKPLASAVDSMYKNLEGKEYVENYIHTMAHELKSPLTGIIATVEVLQQNIPEQDRKQFYNNIQDSSERMSGLIDRLLQLASIENKNHIHKQKIDITSLIEKNISERQPQLEQRKISICTDISPNIIALAEPTLLEQSLGNLIDNAIDFSPLQSTIQINATEVKSTTSPYHFLIEVIDEGCGLTAKNTQRVFERFYSTPRPDTLKRSSGLGLSFVKQAIDLHGGKIDIRNNPTGGVTARIYLPS